MTDAQMIVTIDGPAASGKSSVSRELAKRLGWTWVSTGTFYRGLAYLAFKNQMNLEDEDALVALAESPTWKVEMRLESTRFMVDGVDVTEDINREEIGSLASRISSLPRVRVALLEAQRRCAIGLNALIAEGRDCGTVVFPDAKVKVFLTARAEDRAARRAREEGRDLDQTIDDQRRRDAQDANRKAAPMQAPADSEIIDTTTLSFVEVVEKVEEIIRRKLPPQTPPQAPGGGSPSMAH